ncbi:MAG: T9SS type A sorting domain-containing protein [Calditrichia bacterium]
MKLKTVLITVFLLGMSLRSIYAQYPNVRVSSPGSMDPEEVTIAINPANPMNLAAGANISYYYYSMDGGYNWNQGNLVSPLGVYGDPCVNFDVNGNLYYAHLSNPASGYWLDRIVVQKSENGGMSWSEGAGVGLNPPKQQDKEWLVADLTSSAFRNNLYIAWTQFDSYGGTLPRDSTRILFSHSSDFGETWSAQVRVSDRLGNCLDGDSTVEGAVPAVGPEGQVYISWSGPWGIFFDKSEDGGLTFGRDVFVDSQPGGWDFNVSGIYRCDGLPVTLCDVSNSPYRGTIYILWSDQRNGEDNTDIFLKKSIDGGKTWSDLIKVNDDTSNRQQFFPWGAVDPATGILYVVFYDRRNTLGDTTDVYVARSMDGGETFENFRVSESSFLPHSNVFFGDYINIAALNGKIYPIWMRMDGDNLSVWVAHIDDTPIALGHRGEQIQEGFTLHPNYPNPFNSQTRISYYLPISGEVRISVYSALGKKIAVLADEFRIAGNHSINFEVGQLPSGIYFCEFSSGQYHQIRKMILMK